MEALRGRGVYMLYVCLGYSLSYLFWLYSLDVTWSCVLLPGGVGVGEVVGGV